MGGYFLVVFTRRACASKYKWSDCKAAFTQNANFCTVLLIHSYSLAREISKSCFGLVWTQLYSWLARIIMWRWVIVMAILTWTFWNTFESNRWSIPNDSTQWFAVCSDGSRQVKFAFYRTSLKYFIASWDIWLSYITPLSCTQCVLHSAFIIVCPSTVVIRDVTPSGTVAVLLLFHRQQATSLTSWRMGTLINKR